MLFPVYAESVLEETALFAALLRALPIGLGGISALIGGTPLRSVRTEADDTHRDDRRSGSPARFSQQKRRCSSGVSSATKASHPGFKTAGGQTYLISVVPSNRLGLATGLYFINMTVGNAGWECDCRRSH